MKVLQTIGGFGAKSGGTSTCTYDLISAIHGLHSGNQIDLLTPDVTESDDRLMGCGEMWIKTVRNDYITPFAFSHNIRNELERSDYDIYHTNGMWMYVNHKTCSVARAKGKPYVITPHGMLYPETLARNAWKKWPVRKLWFDRDIREAACIHATCEAEMKHLRTLGYNGPVALIGNPVAVPDYTKEMVLHRIYDCEHPVRLGFLGRLHPRKHVESIMEGASMTRDVDFEIFIMGKGDEEYEQFLHGEAKRLGIENRVHFLGFLNGKDKFDQLAKMDALFVPSDMENFGMIIPEALIVGTPVMASLGTPWEALNTAGCGWWCDNSPESIANVIEKLYRLSPDERKTMGANGRDYILRTYSSERIATQMLQLYQWLAKENDRPDFVYTE